MPRRLTPLDCQAARRREKGSHDSDRPSPDHGHPGGGQGTRRRGARRCTPDGISSNQFADGAAHESGRGVRAQSADVLGGEFGGKSISGVRITRSRKAGNGLLSKRIALGADGRPAPYGLPCRTRAGTATRVDVTGASRLADLITEMASSEALILGDYVAEGAAIRLVKDGEAKPAPGLCARTLSIQLRPTCPASGAHSKTGSFCHADPQTNAFVCPERCKRSRCDCFMPPTRALWP